MQTLLHHNVELWLETKESMIVSDWYGIAMYNVREYLQWLNSWEDFTLTKTTNKITLERWDVTMTQEWFDWDVVKDFPDYEFLWYN